VSKETEVLTPVRELRAAGEQPANLVPLAGGRQISVFEKGIDFLMQRGGGTDADMEKLQQLMQMQERWEENQARKAFVAAMAQFKRNPPAILKTKLVEFETNRGGRTSYLHEELGEICELIVKGLAEVGISHRWRPHREAGNIGVSCVLTHELGHEQDDGAMWASADTSGGKNSIQAMASSTKYLERYTLLMAVGLAPKGMVDDDGAGHADPYPAWAHEIVKTVNAAQTADELRIIRKVAAGRCQKEKAVIAWNELINPAVKQKAEAMGWVSAEQGS
jgi:hypothetical protein